MKIPVVILCGGMGTRLSGIDTTKPLINIGELPIIVHIMNYYAKQGYTRFHLCMGYNSDRLVDYFRHTTIPWDVQLWDTGADTGTMGRLAKIEKHLPNRRFFLTYCDVIHDTPLNEFVRFHDHHRRLVTALGVKQEIPYGVMSCNHEEVLFFNEKPPMPEHQYISGGMFLMERDTLALLSPSRHNSLEEKLFPFLATQGHMRVYRHSGYWQGMNTISDWHTLQDSYTRGESVWMYSKD